MSRLLLIPALMVAAQALAFAQNAAADESGSCATATRQAQQFHAQRRFADAETRYREALVFCEKEFGNEHAQVASVLNNLAAVLKTRGQADEAERLSRKALAIRESSLGSEHADVAIALNNLAGVLDYLGRYDEAEALFRRALAINEKNFGGESRQVAKSLGNLALLFENTGRYDEAEKLLRQALAISETSLGSEHAEVALLLHNLANLLRTEGKYDDAAPLVRRSLAINEKVLGSEHPSVALNLNNLALLLKTTGRYGEAEPLYRRALVIWEKALGPNHPQVATTLNNLAMLLQATGRLAESEPLCRRVVAIDEKTLGPERPDLAASLSNLAWLLNATQRTAEAEAFYRRALIISEKSYGKVHPDVALRLNNLAGLLEAKGTYAEAEPLYRRALAINTESLGAEHALVAISLNNLASLTKAMGNKAEAESLYIEASRIAQTAGEPAVAWNVHSSLMTFYRDASPGNSLLAIFYGKQAVNTLQGIRGNLKSAETSTQRAYLDLVREKYLTLAGLLVDEGRLPEAQQVLAMLKEEEFFDFVRRDGASDSRSTRSGLNTTESAAASLMQEHAGRLFALGEEIRALELKRNKGGLDEGEQARLRELRRALRSGNEAFEAALADIKSSFKALADNQQRIEQERRNLEQNLTGVVGELGPDVALLQTITLPDGLLLLLTTDKVRQSYKVAMKESEINQLIFKLLATLRSPRIDPRPAAAKLYDALIRPLADDLVAAKTKTLMFSLDGSLRYVPMAVLFDGEKYLAERYAISLFNEAAKTSIKDRPKAQWQAAGLGVSKGLAGFSPLPAVPDELRAIVGVNSGGVLPGEISLDEAFTRDTLLDAVADGYPALHIASHFKFQPGNNTDSFLLLGNGEKLTLADFNLKVSLPKVELLTLSACETAVSGGRGTEVEGLAVTAQLKGAKAVLATLWPVADESTGKFMRNFYKLREEQQLSKAEALRQAQITFISGGLGGATGTTRGAIRATGNSALPAFVANQQTPYAHPFYWAPFVLMGNWL